MSRTGSFPLDVAHNLISEHALAGSTVLDPFCGKGTVLLAARMLGCSAYGMDVAPEAVVCSLAKVQDVTLESVQRYVRSMRAEPLPVDSVPPTVRIFFEQRTLSQILGIQQVLMRDSCCGDVKKQANAVFVMATLLGILHGHASYSLSVPSAHAYSMSPAYVERYAMKHGLKAPARDVRQCLLEKASRCLEVPLPKAVPADVRRASAVQCSMKFPDLVGKVDLIVTSPPYLNAQTYAKDNWLRIWLLGYAYRDILGDYIATGCLRRYRDSMTEVFRDLRKMFKPGGRLICVAGDISLGKGKGEKTDHQLVRTGLVLAELSESSEVGLDVVHTSEHTVPSSSRYFHSLSKSNGHAKRDLVERVFIAVKPSR